MPDRTDDSFVILSDRNLAGLEISVGDIVGAIEQAIAQEADGAILTTPKAALLRGDGRYMMTTLASADDSEPAQGLTIVKSVMVSPRNPARGRPGVDGAILVQDAETGAVLALMQAGWITAMRTAGLSAVAARRLADPHADRVAFIGAGVQARSHLRTFAALFPLRAVTIFGRGRANIDRLGELARDLNLDVTICDSARAAVAAADLIVSSVTLSHGMAPLVDARWLKPGAFATITDMALPWVADGMDAFAALYVDDMEQERASATKMVSSALISGDLKHLVCTPAPILSPQSRRAFVFRGLAIGDFALARLAYQRAVGTATGAIAGFDR